MGRRSRSPSTGILDRRNLVSPDPMSLRPNGQVAKVAVGAVVDVEPHRPVRGGAPLQVVDDERGLRSSADVPGNTFTRSQLRFVQLDEFVV